MLQQQIARAIKLQQLQARAHAAIEGAASQLAMLAVNSAEIGTHEALIADDQQQTGQPCTAVVIVLSGPVPAALLTTLRTQVMHHKTQLQEAMLRTQVQFPTPPPTPAPGGN